MRPIPIFYLGHHVSPMSKEAPTPHERILSPIIITEPDKSTLKDLGNRFA